MKKVFSFFAIIIFLAINTVSGQVRSSLDLMGIWTDNQIRVEFVDNSTVSVVFTGNKKQEGTYTSDFLLDPATLEMSFRDGNNLLEFKCLIQFLDNNTLKWEVFKKNDYPLGFSNAASVLKRIKN